MALDLMCVSMLVIAVCQCFHAFKLYNRLIAMEMLLNAILNAVTVKEIFKDPKTIIKALEKKPTKFHYSDELRALQSQKKKEWWAKKRAQDAQKTSAPESLMVTEPMLDG